jgi:hypothetical protein
VLENSQVKLYCVESTKSGHGNNLTVNWKLEFNPTISGKTCTAWMKADDDEALSSGWVVKGAFKVRPVSRNDQR